MPQHQAQPLSLVSNQAYQLADVCRIEVVYRITPNSDPFFFNLSVADEQIWEARIYQGGLVAGFIEDTPYENQVSLDFSPSFPIDSNSVTFTMTVRFNLSPDPARRINNLRIASGSQALETQYSFANNCPKGN